MTLGQLIDSCVQDALPRFSGDGYPLQECDLQLYSWPQTWGDTAGGFPGIGGQTISGAQCVVVAWAYAEFAVYHDGRFAYFLTHPTEKFFQDLASLRLAGYSENWGKYIRQLKSDGLRSDL